MTQAATHPRDAVHEALDRLIAPLSAETFLTHHWEQGPCLIARGQGNHHAGLGDFCELDHLIGHAWNHGHMSFIREGITQRPETVLGRNNRVLSGFYARFSEGDTVRLEKMERRHPAVAELVNHLAAAFAYPVTAELYATPGDGLVGELGTGDACFLLQLAGSSRWSVDQTYHLAAGDTLYLPRQTARGAAGGAEAGLFLLVRVSLKTVRDLILASMAKVSDAREDLRGALPNGGPLNRANDARLAEECRALFPGVMAALDIADTRDKTAFAQIAEMSPLPDKHFLQLHLVESLSADTPLERRPGMIGHMRLYHDKAHLAFPGGFFHGPEKLFLALDFVAETRAFRPREIPGWYTDKERVTICKHLVRKGFLRIVTE